MLYIVLTQTDILMVTSEEQNNVLSLPTRDNIAQLEDFTQVLSSNDTEHVLVISNSSGIPSNFKIINIRFVLNHVDFNVATRVIYYQQLFQYYCSNKYCGKCASPTIRREKTKFVFCPSCASEIYPHIAPCIMVRIHKGNDILMARGVNFPPNRWGLIAGFVEIGETLEEAVFREVKEEVGLEIENLKYWGSQPWIFPNITLMVGFTATYKSGDIAVQPNEIIEAEFFSRNNIPGMPSSKYSIASKLINDYLENDTNS